MCTFYLSIQTSKRTRSFVLEPHILPPKEDNYFNVASVALGPKFSSMDLYPIDIPLDHRCHVNVSSIWELEGTTSCCFISKCKRPLYNMFFI
jgi:hypothetical protein